MASWRFGLLSVCWIFSSKATDIGLSSGQNFREMQGFYGQAGARESAAQLHEATRVDRDDGVRAGLLDRLDLRPGHAARDFGKFDGESAAETAALLGEVHLAELQA